MRDAVGDRFLITNQMTMTPSKPSLAMLMLCCRDYEAVELALACHMAYGDPTVPFFVLHNCKGDYDTDRTLAAIRRYESLYPDRIQVIDPLEGDYPYCSVSEALHDQLREYDYICKVDDDAFPITPGWLDTMWQTWTDGIARYGDKLGYVTPLLNNNCWGFPEVLKVLGLEETYFSQIARPHRVGGETLEKDRRVLPADQIFAGGFGTIWGSTDIARWLHEETTLKPDRYIEATKDLEPTLVDSEERYSIGCLLFRRELWAGMDDGTNDDEEMIYRHCRDQGLKIVCARSVPFVHLTYYPQKDELRDVVRAARDLYASRGKFRHTIQSKPSQLDEIESRLRYIEKKMRSGGSFSSVGGGLIGDAREADVITDIRESTQAQAAPPRAQIGKLAKSDDQTDDAANSSLTLISNEMAQAQSFKRSVDTLRHALSLAPFGGIALEFGVGSGHTLGLIAAARSDGRVYGFDSFKGLPEAWREGYPAGTYASAKLPEVQGAEIVTGTFNKTLPQFLVDNFDPLDFVHLDCDLYSSTQTVLKLIEHRLLPGTVLLFGAYFNYPGWLDHQHKAWTEFVACTGTRFEYTSYSADGQEVSVRILEQN